jgi:hypothetical protein
MSDILKLQDKNGDGLIDICEVALPREETRCLECRPKPSALVTDWKKTDIYSPFLNQKICKFQITYTTPYTTTGGESTTSEDEAEEILNSRYEEFEREAASAILDYYNKENNSDTIDQLIEVIEYTDYDLAAIPLSHLKLLYSFPFDILNQMDDAEEEEEEEPEPGEDVVVTYIPNILQRNLIRVRKGLHLYNSNLKVYRALDGKNLLFEDGGVFNLEQYGDFAIFGTSIMSRLFSELGDFFRQNGFTLGRRNPFFPSRDAVYKFECTFSPEFEIKKIRVWSEACKEKPYVLGRKKVKVLNNKQAFKDPTAMSYFAKIDKMETQLTARRPKPWVDFLVEHTYPKIYDTQTKPPQELSSMGQALSCVGENLQNDVKELGQDMMDEVFGIGDAVAAQFHKMICEPEYTEVLLNEYVKGKNDTPEEREKKEKNQAKRRKNVRAKGMEQAYGELETNNVIMTGICHRLMAICGGAGSQNKFDALWLYTLDPLRLCGLFDLMGDLLKCLMKGMDFQQMMASMIRAALKAMSIENFGSLFVGLPPEKQRELDAMVQEKLASGEISSPGRALNNASTAIETGRGPTETPFIGRIKIDKPWDNPEVVAQQKTEMMVEGPLEGMVPTGVPASEKPESTSQLSKATYAAQATDAGAGLSPNVIMEAYMKALIEVYSDDLMALLNELNKFPGAEIIAKVIATFDCARPPLFDPSIMDFLKDLELPFCRNVQHIGLPRMDNPFAWIPKIWDIFRLLWYLAKEMLYDLVWRLICRLFVFICEKISDAICKALELAGSLAAAALSGGRTTFADAIRDTLCGPGADQEKVENTIEDLFKQIGQGGAEVASDRQSLLNFVEDLSATTTQNELLSAMVGEPSSTFLDVVDSLTNFEHPQFQVMFPNGEQTAQFFTNIGNLMPPAARAAVRDALASMPDDVELPANPTLCASQEDLDNFCNVRAEILAGRASSEQIQDLCANARGSFQDDLDDVADLMQGGIPAYFENNMPPLMSSDPTCDDGLIPYEPEEIATAASTAMGGSLDVLKIAYAQDMLGNGPGRNKWGFVNMVLSDTMGNPYTTHIRKSFNSGGWLIKRKYVDYYVDSDIGEDQDANFAKVKRQRGAFPSKVAGYLQDQMEDQFSSINFELKNTARDDKTWARTFSDLGLGGLFDDIDLTELPNYGYNITSTPDYSNKKIRFTRNARKKDADLKLSFKDRGAGRDDLPNDTDYLYGFDIRLFTSDIIKGPDQKYYNRPDDNARIIIRKKINVKYKGPGDAELKNDEQDAKDKQPGNEDAIVVYPAYEFLSVDDGLNLNSSLFQSNNYNEFLLALQSPISTTHPSIILFNEMLEVENGSAPSIAQLKTTHQDFTKKLTAEFGREIYENNKAFNYGAVFDDLSEEDVEYGIVTNNSFELVSDYIERKRREDPEFSVRDVPFGMSRMQFKEEYRNGQPNRVFYLSPASYGGSNINPAVYLKPAERKGWLGIVDAMFPELSPCKPSRTDLVDFGEIKQLQDEIYNKIAEDKRLKSDPDCVTEKPYNRILERNSKAGIEGLIHAACRVFASQHFLKSLATFTKFKPDLRNNFSSLYASYIVEIMEEELKDAQPSSFFEAFSPFKDDEFWYAFLEQSVQCYARKVSDGDVEPSPAVVNTLEQLEDFEKKYRFPYTNRLRQAKKSNETGPFQTLKNYRFERNLEAVKESEDLAKLILKEFVIEEMNYMGEVFLRNLKEIGMVNPNDMINNLNYYLLQNLTVNTELDLQKEIKETVTDLPTSGENHYTNGGELANEETGDPYTGYYHVHQDEETGEPVFMEGEEHTSGDHALLFPFASKLIVPIGTINGIDTGATGTTDKPFVAETYIKVNGSYYSPSEGVEVVTGNDMSLRIADVYPGTMTVTRDENEKPIGLTGQLGVRYGLRFSITVGGTNYKITEVEVDALDLPIGQFQPLEPNSKLMFCLLNNLIDDEKYKIVTSYIMPVKKILSTLAIYNDMGFLPSIGENTKTLGTKGITTMNAADKPGMYIVVGDDGEVSGLEGDPDGAWAEAEERWPGIFRGNGFFGLHFDKWDRRIFPRTKPRIKRLFKNYYNQRHFNPGDDEDVGASATAALAESFKFSPGERHFPWFKKGLLRSNPFDKNGNMCKK